MILIVVAVGWCGTAYGSLWHVTEKKREGKEKEEKRRKRREGVFPPLHHIGTVGNGFTSAPVCAPASAPGSAAAIAGGSPSGALAAGVAGGW